MATKKGWALALACSASCASSPPQSTSPPGAEVPAPAPSAAAAAASSAPAEAPAQAKAEPPGPPKARKVELPGLSLRFFVEGQKPSPERPKGTVVALAEGIGGGDSTGLVEVDVATGQEVRRSKASVAGRARLVREGDTLHIGAVKGSFVWLTTDLALEEKRRVTTKLKIADENEFYGFAVFDGKAVVVDASTGAVAHVMDDQGKMLAHHDCKSGLYHPGHAVIERVGELAVIPNLLGNMRDTVCGFRVDGKGPTIRAKHPEGTFFFTHGGAAYAEMVADGGKISRLDGQLRATGAAVADPRSCGGSKDPCGPSRSACSGITGEAVWQSGAIGGVGVFYTIRCCGGPSPGGFFLCDAGTSSAAP